MSNYLFDAAKAGDLLRIDGPRGTFVLRHTPVTDIIFLATGTGIAPIKAMLERIMLMPKEERPNSVKVFWGMRSREDLYWTPQNGVSYVNFIKVLSKGNSAWNGERGHVQDVMMKSWFEIENLQIYACGSDKMIRSSREIAISNGLNTKQFFSDAFVASNRRQDSE